MSFTSNMNAAKNHGHTISIGKNIWKKQTPPKTRFGGGLSLKVSFDRYPRGVLRISKFVKAP